jgi:hypothetical protein
VLGLDVTEAQKLMKDAKLNVIVEGQGSTIIQTMPRGDSKVEAGTTVYLFLGNEGDKPALSLIDGLLEDEDEDVSAMKELNRQVPEVLGRLKE